MIWKITPRLQFQLIEQRWDQNVGDRPSLREESMRLEQIANDCKEEPKPAPTVRRSASKRQRWFEPSTYKTFSQPPKHLKSKGGALSASTPAGIPNPYLDIPLDSAAMYPELYDVAIAYRSAKACGSVLDGEKL